MNKRLSRILLFAFVLAAASSYVVYRIAGSQLSAAGKAQTTKIVLAARSLEIGSVVREADVRLGEWVGTPPKGAMMTKESVVGRGVVSSLYEGEPVFESRLA